MIGNKQQSTAEHAGQNSEIGIVITRPRGYLAVKSAFLLGRVGVLNARLVELTGAAAGDEAVDIGCGPGQLVRALAQQVGPSGRVLGIDPSAAMIDYATGRAKALSNCRFEVGTAQSLNLPDASVDVVTSTFVMHHIPEAKRAEAMAHMFRVLRPGGRLLLADTHPTGLVLPAVIRIMSRFAAHRTDDAHAAGHRADPLAAVDIRRYREALRENGFETVDFTALAPTTGVLVATKNA
ncbi:methyltransferase domain-containing protein [Nocardia sp. NBC_00565]|uniref:methyltransferase domain-containing protein n=1 Tax=Nocardia sp. NBC_00565 TaxID=2975993 RepID=UPI002E818482|nr:methyltransferase domain-containing protein [Nocardia sp. NBC_00565]WUC02196.1 methyltransferase domain-containing protein [Nocardia sp. NBC_00565]